ncbi:MAG TPA: sodium:solute symporter [Treponema sp.]|nr:sodium:solute symporter [Treponema sp.]
MKALTKGKIWLFAIGQFGWALLSGLIGSWLVSFYLPSDEAIASGQTILIPQGRVILGLLTVIGGVTALGRVFDAITDPLVASLSDKCKSKDGRRIPFLKWAALPFAITTVLVFWAPFDASAASGSLLNSIWVCVMVLAYYFCITLYCTPYTALYSEITHTEKERMLASSAISLTFIVGTAVGYLGPMVWGALTPVLGSRMLAIRITFALFALVALVCMYVPVFAIKEKDYVTAQPSQASMMQSLSKTFKNSSFRVFVGSDVFYWIGLTMFQTGIPYFVTSLLKLPEAFQSMFLVLMTAISLLFYVPINAITAKVGKKKMVVFAFAMFTLVFAFTAFTHGSSEGAALINTPFGKASLSQLVQGLIMIVCGALPMAIFGILPQAMVADCAEYDAKCTGESRQGMFFAARTFCMKLGQALAMVIFTSLATLGINSATGINSGSGYRIAAMAAAVLCAIGGIILLFYNERKVLGKEA